MAAQGVGFLPSIRNPWIAQLVGMKQLIEAVFSASQIKKGRRRRRKKNRSGLSCLQPEHFLFEKGKTLP